MGLDGIQAGATRAVLLDALGTLIELEAPWPALARELTDRGFAVSRDDARRALLAEMRHYKARCHVAGDRATLQALRDECTEVLRAALPPPARDVPARDLQAALLASLRFRPFPEVPGVLAALRDAGKRLVVVSNWDISLHDVLAATGLDALVDGVVTSAEAGASKPAGAIFARGLALAGVGAAEAVHVGDDVDTDVMGARAAGIRAVLVMRDGESPAAGVAGAPSIRTLAGLGALAR